MKIKIPEEYKFPMIKKYVEKHTKNIREHINVDAPCSTCITLSMCLNKDPSDILYCPLLHPILYRLAINTNHDSTIHGIFVTVNPLGITFWISRVAADYAFVDVVENGELKFISLRIEFDKGDIE